MEENVCKTSIFLALLFTLSVFATDYKLYYLGGQSNMVGLGYNQNLPVELINGLPEVYIFHGNSSPDTTEIDGKGIWEQLKPGHGVGFSSDGQTNHLSERFGVELTFAHRLLFENENEKIALIKYSRGGSSIDKEAAGIFGCWEPDYDSGNRINQYDHFLATITNAFAVSDIDGDGQEDRLIPSGIVWMQGESDAAYSLQIAERYENNLKRLMDLIRAALRSDDLPVVIGQISDSGQDENDGTVWDYGDIVRSAQLSYVSKDIAAILVQSTENYQYSDPWHYDNEGHIDLGHKFAEAILKLSK
jgi:hypothetical protein